MKATILQHTSWPPPPPDYLIALPLLEQREAGDQVHGRRQLLVPDDGLGAGVLFHEVQELLAAQVPQRRELYRCHCSADRPLTGPMLSGLRRAVRFRIIGYTSTASTG